MKPSTKKWLVIGGFATAGILVGSYAYAQSKRKGCPPKPAKDRMYMDTHLKPHPQAMTAQELAALPEGTKVGMAASLHEAESGNAISGETVHIMPARLTREDGILAIVTECEWLGRMNFILRGDRRDENFAQAFAKSGFVFPVSEIGKTIPREYVA